MKLNKSTAVMDYKLVTAFESVRKRLLRPKFADRLDKPLAYWAIATDRRLPLAFMGRSLRELLDTPFDDLFSTAGIGQKKIRTFLMLLNRAAQPKPLGALAADEEDIPDAANESKAQTDVVNPSIVSEALWVRWRASVRNYGLDQEPLGRFAATLLDMPRVIWQRPLGSYTELTLAEIRSLRTHGEKRVSAVLDVFGNLHRILVNLDSQSRLAVRIVPRFLIPIEAWVLRWLTNVGVPTKDEVRDGLVSPLIEQIKGDCGPLIARLAEGRLDSQSGSVRKAAHKLGLTRARIYQLLSEVAEVTTLRWPAGAALLGQLRNKMHDAGTEPDLLAWLDTVIELFFVRARTQEEAESSPQHDEVAREGVAHNGSRSRTHERNGGTHGRNGHEATSKATGRRRSGSP
ncbi:MAG TPA: hypothetical protein VG826_10955 [Pirellulales bacterium]|nr:hypothetical protein [Pirellulales bacterium]